MLYGPRTGSRDRHFAIPPGLAPGPLRDLFGLRVREVSSLRPNLSVPVTGEADGRAVRWREFVETELDPLCRFADGAPALTANGNHHYLACWPDAELLSGLMALVARRARLDVEPLPEGVRLRRRGNLTFAFNYGEGVWTAPEGAEFLLGGREVGPQDLAMWRG